MILLPLKTPCVHSWTTDDAYHVHSCRDLVGCHAAPCQCKCGAEDWCTEHPTLDTRFTGRRPPHNAKRPR